MRDNCLYMSEAVIKNWDIDLTKQITLKLSPRVSQPNSKKLDYLLNMNNINISMYISEKQDDCIDMHVLKQSFVDGFMRYLTMS